MTRRLLPPDDEIGRESVTYPRKVHLRMVCVSEKPPSGDLQRSEKGRVRQPENDPATLPLEGRVRYTRDAKN